MNRAIFMDRDGVINEKAAPGAYITKVEELRILPGAAAGMAILRNAGFRLVVATNQRCIAKGLLTPDGLDILHEKLGETLRSEGVELDGIYYCPHEKESCGCRKPAPGMLLEAANDLHLDLASSWMIGDHNSDIAAGRSAGCRTVRLSNPDEKADGSAEVEVATLLDAARQIVRLA